MSYLSDFKYYNYYVDLSYDEKVALVGSVVLLLHNSDYYIAKVKSSHAVRYIKIYIDRLIPRSGVVKNGSFTNEDKIYLLTTDKHIESYLNLLYPDIGE